MHLGKALRLYMYSNDIFEIAPDNQDRDSDKDSRIILSMIGDLINKYDVTETDKKDFEAKAIE